MMHAAARVQVTFIERRDGSKRNYVGYLSKFLIFSRIFANFRQRYFSSQFALLTLKIRVPVPSVRARSFMYLINLPRRYFHVKDMVRRRKNRQCTTLDRRENVTLNSPWLGNLQRRNVLLSSLDFYALEILYKYGWRNGTVIEIWYAMKYLSRALLY